MKATELSKRIEDAPTCSVRLDHFKQMMACLLEALPRQGKHPSETLMTLVAEKRGEKDMLIAYGSAAFGSVRLELWCEAKIETPGCCTVDVKSMALWAAQQQGDVPCKMKPMEDSILLMAKSKMRFPVYIDFDKDRGMHGGFSDEPEPGKFGGWMFRSAEAWSSVEHAAASASDDDLRPAMACILVEGKAEDKALVRATGCTSHRIGTSEAASIGFDMGGDPWPGGIISGLVPRRAVDAIGAVKGTPENHSISFWRSGNGSVAGGRLWVVFPDGLGACASFHAPDGVFPEAVSVVERVTASGGKAVSVEIEEIERAIKVSKIAAASEAPRFKVRIQSDGLLVMAKSEPKRMQSAEHVAASAVADLSEDSATEFHFYAPEALGVIRNLKRGQVKITFGRTPKDPALLEDSVGKTSVLTTVNPDMAHS
ncbi:MAG: hypothetical protein LCH53_14030 [Bacteroidetes bacterium]|nr:hypothetical protein [Bacteroidota bacterium]